MPSLHASAKLIWSAGLRFSSPNFKCTMCSHHAAEKAPKQRGAALAGSMTFWTLLPLSMAN